VRNCAPGNLEIPGSRFARPGMTPQPAVCAPSAYKPPRICYCCAGAESINRAPGRTIMAKGQMRSNKEKKKPKADKNLKKGGAAPVNPFASGKTPAGQSPNSNKK